MPLPAKESDSTMLLAPATWVSASLSGGPKPPAPPPGSHSSQLARASPMPRGTGPHAEQIVEPGQGLQEDVGTLIGELVAAGNEEVQGLVQVEVQVTVKMTTGQGEARDPPLPPWA